MFGRLNLTSIGPIGICHGIKQLYKRYKENIMLYHNIIIIKVAT